MNNNEIHDLINLKARRLVIEVTLGISNINRAHLSKKEVDHIKHDLRHTTNLFTQLNHLNDAIQTDERVIKKDINI